MFITFEGPNGAGKTTLIRAVTDKLSRLGWPVLKTKEPTNSPLGEFFKKGEESYRKECLACIAAADRYFHIESEISPAIEARKIILSDRYVESSLVLQRLDGCDMDFVWALHSKILVPDLSIILLASPEVLRARLRERRKSQSRFEREKSRESELELYRKAGEFLMLKGFKIMFLNNTDSLEENVDFLINEIKNRKAKEDLR